MKLPKLNLEEIFIGAMLQFPLYFIISWWIIPIQLICGVLWSLGGAENSSKLFRRIGVPLVVCLATFLKLHNPLIFLAIPLMIWLCPSYGNSTKLFNFWLKMTRGNRPSADLLTRLSTFLFYWASFCTILLLSLTYGILK